jgi:agmatine/peptidylarginine deiminase
MQAKGLVPEHHKVYRRETASAVRAIAEFEPMGGVLLAFPGTTTPPVTDLQLPPSGVRAFGVPDELIVRMQQAGRVHIFVICNDASQLPLINASLAAAAHRSSLPFDPELVHLVPWDSDTYWTRDYGPWWVEAGTGGELGIGHHVYTSLGSGSVGMVEGNQNKLGATRGGGIFRPNDTSAAEKFSDFLDVPVRAWNEAGRTPRIAPHHWYFSGLLAAGGNYMTTGDGFVASSYLVARQNEVPGPDTIDNRMEYITSQKHRFFGIDRYLVLTDPSGTYIGHIDCWAKLLDRRSVLIARSPDPAIDKAYDGIAAEFAALDFTVHRVLCPLVDVPGDAKPTAAPYCNSLILNDEVYVPLAAVGQDKANADALDVYRAALPDHHIFGIVGKPDDPWRGTDALHCRTCGVPRRAVEHWLRSQR